MGVLREPGERVQRAGARARSAVAVGPETCYLHDFYLTLGKRLSGTKADGGKWRRFLRENFGKFGKFRKIGKLRNLEKLRGGDGQLTGLALDVSVVLMLARSDIYRILQPVLILGRVGIAWVQS